jgi:hypothetical protein
VTPHLFCTWEPKYLELELSCLVQARDRGGEEKARSTSRSNVGRERAVDSRSSCFGTPWPAPAKGKCCHRLGIRVHESSPRRRAQSTRGGTERRSWAGSTGCGNIRAEKKSTEKRLWTQDGLVALTGPMLCFPTEKNAGRRVYDSVKTRFIFFEKEVQHHIFL